MTRQQFGLVLSDLSELTFQSIGDAGVERASRPAQHGAVRRVLHEGVLEGVDRFRWLPAA